MWKPQKSKTAKPACWGACLLKDHKRESLLRAWYVDAVQRRRTPFHGSGEGGARGNPAYTRGLSERFLSSKTKFPRAGLRRKYHYPKINQPLGFFCLHFAMVWMLGFAFLKGTLWWVPCWWTGGYSSQFQTHPQATVILPSESPVRM